MSVYGSIYIYFKPELAAVDKFPLLIRSKQECIKIYVAHQRKGHYFKWHYSIM